jgi:hypothetical protein
MSFDGLGPVGVAIGAFLTLIIGGGGGGFLVAFLKDRRQVPLDKAASDKAEIDILEQLRQMAKDAVAESVKEMHAQDERHGAEIKRLTENNRQEISQLTHIHSEEVRVITSRYDEQVLQLERRVQLLEEMLSAHNLSLPRSTSKEN